VGGGGIVERKIKNARKSAAPLRVTVRRIDSVGASLALLRDGPL
jgi:hypothetical protein